ncbi:DUF6232 family protein [Plantactinospora siamensis]|uniref:DUF6232 family protein n=1 Tax=Plantactinospora siamensis TaxID=555372 RepID=A0ABV6NVD0_9ACTN
MSRLSAQEAITYYDDGAVLVTSAVVRVGQRGCPIGDIERVWVERGGRSWRVLAGRGGLALALLGTLAAAVLALVVAVRLHASGTVTVALIGAACLLGLAVLGPLPDLLLDRLDRSYAHGSAQLRLWVLLRGHPVPLLTSRDALRFGQIHRALRRALERSAPPVPGRH